MSNLELPFYKDKRHYVIPMKEKKDRSQNIPCIESGIPDKIAFRGVKNSLEVCQRVLYVI